MISAASTSPERTFWIACARVLTRTGWIDWNSRDEYLEASMRWLPSVIVFWLGGTRFRKATRGFSGVRESANPMSSAITTG